jgi:hypothetical protein
LFGPGDGEGVEGFAFEDFFGHGEDDAFFFIEVITGSDDGGEEEFAGGFEVMLGEGIFEAGIDFDVFFVESFLLPELSEAMFERGDDEFVFDLGMGIEDGLEESGEEMDFGDGFGGGEDGLDVIEEVMEHDVFGEEGFGYFHRSSEGGDVGARADEGAIAVDVIDSADGRPEFLEFKGGGGERGGFAGVGMGPGGGGDLVGGMGSVFEGVIEGIDLAGFDGEDFGVDGDHGVAEAIEFGA